MITKLRFLGVVSAAVLQLLPNLCSGALIDRWLASDLAALDNGDAVGSWASLGQSLASAPIGDEPRLKKNATPTGEPAVEFNRNRMATPNSPVAGRSAFSLAVVFKVNELGVDEGTGWSTKSGIVDANQTGAANDWGFAVRETGFICFGTGSTGGSDQTVYLDNQPTYASVVDGMYHVAVSAWGAGSQTLYIDAKPGKTQTGVTTAARGNSGMSFGGINTGEMTRRFVGELAEVRFYDTALSSTEVSNVIAELSATYLTSARPTISSFTASTNDVFQGMPVTLSWIVKDAALVSIDNGGGMSTNLTGAVQVHPLASTLYTLTASNRFGIRTAQAAVTVDPGIPHANAQRVSAIKETACAITLAGSDPEGAPLVFSIAQGPQHGVLSGQAPNLTYQPSPGYVGADFFTFKASDGTFDSPPATVEVYVDDVARAPHGLFASASKTDADALPGAFVLAFRAVDQNRFDTHTFSLVPGPGAVNNGMFQLDGNQLLAGTGFPIRTDTNLLIRVRATDSSGLFIEQAFQLEAKRLAPVITINEIHYNPPDNTVREEFIELFNPGPNAVDLSGWRLRGGIEFVFSNNVSIGPGAYAVAASNPSVIRARYGITALGPWTGNLSSDGERITLRDPTDAIVDEVEYRSEFPWPIAANGEGASMELINPALDNNLGSSWASSPSPSPGAPNRVYAANAPPNIRQVNHSSKMPVSTNVVKVTAKITDSHGVTSVLLSYQVVSPGNFIPAYLPLTTAQLNANPFAVPAPNPAFETASNWVSVVMHDDGLDGDEAAGDDVYTAVLPVQPNRSLVRYRVTCTDTFGASRRAPFEDDPSLNFAYFVYDGVPAYGGTPGPQLESLPIYFLLTRAADFDACTAYNSAYQLPQFTGNVANEARFVFNWPGAFVCDGEVYDHVRYRLRGANGRYQPGKRSFRIRFNQGRFLAAKDEFGQPYARKWSILNTAKGQSNRLTLTYALNEYINYILLNKVGVPSPFSHYFHWRVIRGPLEAPGNYTGDFYGISWAQENYDARFLEAHNLPKGNLYKLINAQRDVDPYRDMVRQQRYQGPFAVTNGSDAVRIQNALLSPTASQTDDWLLANVNYTNWYAYHAVLEAVRNYDTWPSANKNAAWYFDTDYNSTNQYNGRFWTLPWDWTDTWGPTWNAGQDLAWNGIFSSTSSLHPNMQRDYRNTMRELRDLLLQPDQVNPLIDAVAARLAPLAAADLLRWANATPSGSSYSSLGTAGPGLSQGLAGYAQDMKKFMFTGGNNAWWIDRQNVGVGGWITRLDAVSADAAIPAQPAIYYAGQAGFPLNSLTFECSPFSDPQGAATFGAMQWRVAEVYDTNRPPVDARVIPPMEWDATWDTGKLTVWSNRITIPGIYLQTNKLYRARVRHMDNTGRWSRWSAPVQFSASPVDVTAQLRQDLRISEIMYNPPPFGIYSGDDLEFLELKNIGSNSLDLSGLTFEGLTFTFPKGSWLQPGQMFVLGRNAAALTAKYPGVRVGGIYSGRLDNAGERIALKTPAGDTVLEVTYKDSPPWPATADGLGWSLVLADPAAGSYRASTALGGSPGVDDPPSTIPPVLMNEILTHADPPQLDAVELFNPTDTDVDLAGWFLSDDASNPMKFRIPSGMTISRRGYRVFTTADFNAGGVPFAFSSLGDEAYVFSGDPQSTNLTGYAHGATFGAAANGVSFGRVVNSAGVEDFVPMQQVTLGADNSAPRIGPIVISEIMFFPSPSQGTEDPAAEFIELQNVSGTNVPLYSLDYPTNTWRLRNAVDFDFPSGAYLGSGNRLLVTGFDPGTNGQALAAFRLKYNVATDVPIFGPWSGRLANDGESIELKHPDTPELTGEIPYIVVEKVSYSGTAPWPPGAAGTGQSLQRTTLLRYGNDPANWFAAAPTAGRLSTTVVSDVDGDGLPDLWEMENGTDPFKPNAGADPDGDGFDNYHEFIAGTDPHDRASALRFDSIQQQGESVVLSWTAKAGRAYNLLSASAPDAPAWTSVTNISAAPTNHTVTIGQPAGAPTFYRLAVQTQP